MHPFLAVIDFVYCAAPVVAFTGALFIVAMHCIMGASFWWMVAPAALLALWFYVQR